MVDPYDENLKPITLPNGVVLRAPDDFETLRRNIYDTAKERTAAAFPMSYNGVRVELSDLDYADPDHVSVADQKKAMMEDKSITRRLRGKLRLVNEQDDSLLDERELTLMRVPHLTQRGTFINAGNEYTHSMQARLLHGAYSRRQNNGELETQFNVKPGTGRVFRVGFEPDPAQYRLLQLFPLLAFPAPFVFKNQHVFNIRISRLKKLFLHPGNGRKETLRLMDLRKYALGLHNQKINDMLNTPGKRKLNLGLIPKNLAQPLLIPKLVTIISLQLRIMRMLREAARPNVFELASHSDRTPFRSTISGTNPRRRN
jgi:hypothetical protein